MIIIEEGRWWCNGGAWEGGGGRGGRVVWLAGSKLHEIRYYANIPPIDIQYLYRTILYCRSS